MRAKLNFWGLGPKVWVWSLDISKRYRLDPLRHFETKQAARDNAMRLAKKLGLEVRE